MVVPDRITAKDLNELIERGAIWDLCDYVYAFLKKSDGFSSDEVKNHRIFERLPRGMRMIWHICGIQFEVPNGGFSQFFYNSTGCYAVETLEAFRAIGDTRRAELLQRAIEAAHREAGRPLACRDRWFDIPDESDVLEELDNLYFKLDEEAGDLDRLMTAYVKKAPEEFIHPSE